MAATSSQSSVRRQGADNFKTDEGSPLWRHTTRISQVSGGGSYLWKCNYCQSNKGNPFNCSYSQVKLHFMGPSGKGMGMCKGNDGKGLSNVQIASFIKEQEVVDKLVKRSKQTSYQPPSRKNKMQLPIESIVSSKHPFLQVPIPREEEEEVEINTRKRGSLDTAFKMEARDLVDQAIARCLYANGLPFNLVRSLYWKQMVAAINKAPANYTSLRYEKVHTTQLQKERTSIERVFQQIRTSWKTSGVSIVSNGWKDTRNWPLITVIAVFPKGAMFLKAVDCEEEVKDSQFISRILIETIEMVGSENVVQVITDNAKTCRGAGALVEGRYDHIFWTPCTVHSLNLVMQQIDTQIDWVKQIYQEAEEIQMFVKNHHMSQSIFKSFSKLELLKVASSSVAEWNWSAYSFIHSVKHNRLGSKNVEDIHTNLRLLSRKEDHYKEGAVKHWNVAPECANLDAKFHDLTTTIDDDDDNIMTYDASSASGTVLGSNDTKLAAVGDDEDTHFLENNYDSEFD